MSKIVEKCHSCPFVQPQILKVTDSVTILDSNNKGGPGVTLKSFHWIKVEQRIQNKIKSLLTYNILHSSLLSYHRTLNTAQPPGRTRSGNCLCLALPPLTSKLVFRSLFSQCLTNLIRCPTSFSHILCFYTFVALRSHISITYLISQPILLSP